jgi:KTSC domain
VNCYIEMIPVDSKAIRAVDYDGNHLFVQFHTSDTIYTHPGMPPSVYIGLMQTASLGRYYIRHITGRYR